ncbi:Asp23/Gls24 family envelope stress response protein [Streptomyces sp. NPDC001222]|uniref:Asp23/Gls24 family envelope stress response protein n=1 Tax=Streptomyces sp. NPDC001222 TaxID=3364548 RepID=UPI0036940EAD
MSALPGSARVPDSGPGPPAQPVGLPPAAERGATIIPDKVVARIAAQAARTAQSRRAALPPDRSLAAPSASAASRTGSVRLHLALDLPYPTDITHACERIRHDVAERVAQLTGLHVGEVSFTIRRLVTGAGVNRRRVR